MVELLAVNEKGVGSSPIFHPKEVFVAQLVERWSEKPKVMRSKLIEGTKRYTDVVQLVRIPHCHCGDRGFESRLFCQSNARLAER